MKRRTTFFLKIAVFLVGIPFFGLCILGLPWLVTRMAEMFQVSAYLQYPSLIGLYAAVIPFGFAVYQALKLLNCINKGKAILELSVKALNNIKYCAITIGVLYVIGMPLLFLVADKDDAPGVVALGLLVILASIVTAFFAALFQRRCLGYKTS